MGPPVRHFIRTPATPPNKQTEACKVGQKNYETYPKIQRGAVSVSTLMNNSDVPGDIMSSENLLDACKDHFRSNVYVEKQGKHRAVQTL